MTRTTLQHIKNAITMTSSRLPHLGRVAGLFVLFCTVMAARAQQERKTWEGTTWEQRIGEGKTAIANRAQVVVWTKYTNENQSISYEHPQDAQHPTAFDEYPRTWNDSAYHAWDHLIKSAPYSLFSLYGSGGAGDMLRYLLHKEEDRAVKMIYFDDLMMLSDLRIQNLKGLNSIPRENFGPAKQSTLADVKAWKAHYYYTEGKNIPTQGYDKKKAYEYFVDAMKEVRAQKDVEGTEVEPYLIEEYFSSCFELYQSDPERYRMQFLTDYLDCASTCKRLYETANNIANKDLAEQQFNRYFNEYSQFVKPQFDATQAGHPDSLDQYFKRHLEENKNDIKYVNEAIALMVQNGCLPTVDANRCIERYAAIAYEYPEQLNYYAALAYGLKLNKDAALMMGEEKEQTRGRMKEAFDLAMKKANNNTEKAHISFEIGKALNQKLDPALAGDKEEVQRWRNDMEGVMKYFEDAANYDPTHFAAISNFYTELVYNNIVRAYNTPAYFDSHSQEEKFAIRKEQLEAANTSITYANEAIREGQLAMNNHIYEQQGMYMRQLVANAQNNAPTELAQQLQKSLGNYKARYEKAGVDPVWHNNVWHPYLQKKGRESAFWTGKGQTCQYCGKTFK